jgi:hypothetical protein
LRDSLEWIIWAVPAAAKARRSGDEAPGKTIDFFLTDRQAFATVFQNLRQGRLAVSVAGMARLRFHAKRKGGQVIENKELCEMAYFSPLMISTTYGLAHETVRFARRKESFRFCRFFPLVEAQNARGAKSTVARRLARRRLRDSATRKWHRKPVESTRRCIARISRVADEKYDPGLRGLPRERPFRGKSCNNRASMQ